MKPMEITVNYFGILGERRGLGVETLSELHSCSAADLYDRLDLTHQLGLKKSDFRVAVNDSFVEWSHAIQAGDRVAFLPPMSGG